MASADAPPAPSPDAEVYASHWGRVYETDESARTREWHCDFADCRAFIAPYCARAARGDGTVLDVGCGGSSFGDELRSAFGLERLVLTDIDPGIVRILRDRHSVAEHPSSGDANEKKRVECLVADCTSMPAIKDGSVDVVVDKGTLDALHGDEDKRKTIRECARVVKKNGVIVSVSFASAARPVLLRLIAAELAMDLKLRVIGSGDPKFGHLVHFVAVLGYDLKRDVPEFSEPDDELTRTVMNRVANARSVIEDEPPSADDALTLFDASDVECEED